MSVLTIQQNPTYLRATAGSRLTVGPRTTRLVISRGSSTGAGVSDHGALTGLGDDDHAQYGTVGDLVVVTDDTTLTGLPRAVLIAAPCTVTLPAATGSQLNRPWKVTNVAGAAATLAADDGTLFNGLTATFDVEDMHSVDVTASDAFGGPVWGTQAQVPISGTVLATGSILAGYMTTVVESGGTVTIGERKVRTIPTLTAGLFDGGGTTDCMELVPGDPAGITRPTVTEIDGLPLQGPRVMGVMDPLTAAFSGFWEVFVVAANGTNGNYLEPQNFASPQPSPGDIYFERCEELNSKWPDDAMFGGTPVYVGSGTTWGGQLVFTFGDGLSCDFVALEVTGGGGSGDVVGPASSTDGRAALFDGTTGKLLRQSSAAPVLEGDSRLTDSRTPTAHASSHVAAGSDPLTLAQSQVTNLTTDLAAKVPSTRTINGYDLSANRTLTASDIGAAATSHTHAASDVTSGTMATARLGSGTANAYKHLRGDQAWAGGWEIISEQTLGSDTTSLSFTGLSSFVDIEIRWHARSDASGSAESGLLLTFNSDTGANYNHGRIGRVSNATNSANASAATAAIIGFVSGSQTNTNRRSMGRVHVACDQPAAARKVVFSEWAGGQSTGDNPMVGMAVGEWTNTADAISSLQLALSSSAKFLTGSRFVLLGRVA